MRAILIRIVITEHSRGTPEKFLDAERRVLQAHREKLLPRLAELERIERRLREIDALQGRDTESTQARDGKSGRKRFSTAARGLQVLDLLTAQPELRRKEIAEALGIQIARTGKIVNWLLAQELVEERGGGTLGVTLKAEGLRAMTEGDSP
jgi:hypothetical protein